MHRVNVKRAKEIKMANERITVEHESLQRLADYDVLDRNGKKIGSVDALWEDFSRQAAFIGVKTSWLGMGKAHVIPTQSASVNHGKHQIMLPYEEDIVKNAPAFDAEDEIDRPSEDKIYDYYSKHGLSVENDYRERSPEYIERYGGEYGFEQGEEIQGHAGESTEKTIKLGEERLKVGKREVEGGGIRLRKVVRTEIVNQPVELKSEDVVVERVKSTDKTGSPDFREDEVFIPLRHEEAVVDKESRITEEVKVKKQTGVERENVSDTVRREDLEQRREEN